MLSATQTTRSMVAVRHSCRLIQVYRRCLRLVGVKPCWVATIGRRHNLAPSQPNSRPLKLWLLISGC
ncbi:hypothetical protein D3C80_773580 [compost metagenome]